MLCTIKLSSGVINNKKALPPIPTGGRFRLGYIFSENEYYVAFNGVTAIVDDSGVTKMSTVT